MQRLTGAKILSTCCFLALALSACGPDAKLVPLNIKTAHPERFVCERIDPASDRPALPPTFQIDWAAIQTVDEAHAAHDSYVASIIARDRKVAGYLVRLEGVDFTCWNNMQWQRDYYDALPPDR